MPCGARNLDQSINLPISEDLDVDSNDIKLNLQLLNKYFEVNTLNQTLEQHRNEFRTRSEHLHKRQEALHEREIMFKERIISYEMYIKELAMKRDRSLRRIEDEKTVLKTKQIEIDFLKQEIEKMQDEKSKLEQMILQYQPHLNLLTQIVDQTDRFHSIDEMIEKFDILHASYQDIFITMKTSNDELNDLQRQLLLTIEKKNSKISLMNNRIHDLEQNLIEIQQRTEKIQTEIGSYQQISREHLTENGAIQIAIESMFDLVRKYSHRSRKKEFNLINQCSSEKLKYIDIFLSDLVYYVDYVNNKPKKPVEINQQEISSRIIEEIDGHNRWRGSCEMNRREALIKHHQQPYFSYKIRGEDNLFYTIQMMTTDRKQPSQTRFSLLSNQSSASMILRNKEKKTSVVTRNSDVQPRSSITRSTFQLSNINERIPFSESKIIPRISI